MAMVVVDESCLQADSQSKSGGLVWGSAAAWRCSTFIKWTEWTLAMACGHDDSTINIVLGIIIMPPPHRVEALSDGACLTSVCHVVFIGPKSRTERPRKTKIGTEVAHVTRDSDTTFKVKRSKSTCRRWRHIVAASCTACYNSYRKSYTVHCIRKISIQNIWIP